uniref:Fas-activated serine/threonine kinase n=1 Tax=Callorhinchus milii TaxID=7868 RepID=A0A4W3JTQ4_CALMI|eukprot:gi/632984023/ref/XP_007908935.1/ PREDICTED: fas-activated serine/threonine kinase [Callorhinchus milii]
MQSSHSQLFRALPSRSERAVILDRLSGLGTSAFLPLLVLLSGNRGLEPPCPPTSQRMMYTTRYHACKPGGRGGCYTDRLARPHQAKHSGRKPHHAKKKTWNFIHEKVSYDTFFTMKRLIDRSRTVDEVLRWVTQNPGKVSFNHYPIALQKIGQVVQQQSPSAGTGDSHYTRVSEHEDFQTLCDSIINDCSKFDNFSIVNCLYAVAALGLPSELKIVQVLEEESRIRLSQFNQKDISMVFSSAMKLHPSTQHPLVESCLTGLEKNIEKERHPQTLFLLLSYYKLRSQALSQDTPASEKLVTGRKVLRLVKHTLGHVGNVRDHEMSLLDEMLAACVREASNKSLEIIFSSQLFYENRQEKFIGRLAEELPKKVDNVSPYTMALIAKYIARHRLRETRLLDTIAEFLVKKGEYLDSKVIQKLVFPFSRMNYKPSNQAKFFDKLESVLEVKVLNSPLATVNIVMSMFQLGHFPGAVLHRVFSAPFINNVMNSPYALIVRRYLSLLDAAIQLEFHDYKGPRLEDRYKVMMFDHVLTADEVNRKYSYKGLVAEALRQLIGDQCYKQDEVVAPGYYTDFLLWLNGSGSVLHIAETTTTADTPLCPPASDTKPSEGPGALPSSADLHSLTTDFQKFSPFSHVEGKPAGKEKRAGELAAEVDFLTCIGPLAGTVRSPIEYSPYYPPSDYYSSLTKEQSLESQESSTLSSPSDCLNQPTSAPDCSPVISSTSLFQFPIGKILDEDGEEVSAAQGQERAAMFRAEQTGHDFYDTARYPERQGGPGSGDMGSAGTTLRLCSPPRPEKERHLDSESSQKANRLPPSTHSIVVSVNNKWHYCHNSDILVGSRAMRDRHLQLLGYTVLQLPYHELEKLNGIEEVKQYLREKLLELRL